MILKNNCSFIAGLSFWDYGNSFLLEARRAAADIDMKGKSGATASLDFRYPSYVQDIMG
jgi:urocanate hydratase